MPTTLTTSRAKYLQQQLSDEPEADDARRLTQSGFGLTIALHGDGTDGRERGMLRRDALRHGHAEIRRYPIELGVQRVLVAAARDSLSNREPSTPSPTCSMMPTLE
jgi:hypothetical protein